MCVHFLFAMNNELFNMRISISSRAHIIGPTSVFFLPVMKLKPVAAYYNLYVIIINIYTKKTQTNDNCVE